MLASNISTEAEVDVRAVGARARSSRVFLGYLSITSETGRAEIKDVSNHAAIRAGRPGDVVDAAEYLNRARFETGQDSLVE
ncbi:hypothetical protein GGR56DRAFT_332398 [Xylariaceae sp. FL0804]|nr:hypothetical protein GGR56DRAFT_332398 [Xylariaceae sp. FL0804]